MTLADLSIRNHVFAWMLMAALVVFGLICFTGFGGGGGAEWLVIVADFAAPRFPFAPFFPAFVVVFVSSLAVVAAGLLRGVVVGLVFAALCVGVMLLGGRETRYQLGQRLEQPIVSRVDFDMLDPRDPDKTLSFARGQILVDNTQVTERRELEARSETVATERRTLDEARRAHEDAAGT